MGKIAILPDTLCNQIAAGEVIERPAAVVKELVENSIDAGAGRVSVSLLQGGRKEIRVVDNGAGMSSDDALLALERHGTSKIRTIEDLQAIRSLGFRGEALPSIAAVSRFELVTREPAAVSGTHIRVEGGVLKEVRDAGCPSGTMVLVRDLFYNMPARRKFLRSIDTELSHISDQLMRLSLAHPDIHFQLSRDGRTHYDFPRARDFAGRAAQVLGTEIMRKLKPFSREIPSLKLFGLAGVPELQRTNGQYIFSYINGRPVWDRTLNYAIISAYDTLMPKGRFPVVVLFMDISPQLVDVNVHPTKREVRFRDPGEIMQEVRNAIRERVSVTLGCVGAQSDLPLERVAFSNGQSAQERQMLLRERMERLNAGECPQPPGQIMAPPLCFPSSQDLQPGEGETPLPLQECSATSLSFSSLPVLGQLANAYILLEAPDGLVFLDQHAAHERILYDRLASDGSREPAQRLTQSAVLDLLPREAATLRRWLDRLSAIGFEIEPFGGDSFVIHAVPAALGDRSPESLIREMLQHAFEEEDSPRSDILSRLAKTAACHSAVRAGQRLLIEEIRALLERLDRTPVSATCPHGRPLWFKLTHAEIARMFHRT